MATATKLHAHQPYSNEPITVGIISVRLGNERVSFTLDDGREISLSLEAKHMDWLKRATPEQRLNWRILGPDGWAVEWPDLDEGIEVEHLLLRHPF